MTLLPSDDFGIKGVEGKAYDVGEKCWVPGCNRRAIHVHHMWPRSFLRGQPVDWVSIPPPVITGHMWEPDMPASPTIVGNRCGLCFEHHDRCSSPVGGHQARIIFIGGVFFWEIRDRIPGHNEFAQEVDLWVRIGALDPQPPGAAKHVKKKPVSVADQCPTCGHTAKKKKDAIPAGPKRKAKEWTMSVPDDAEIGADVLDEWADDIAIILGFDDERSRLRRYHATATALAWTVQNREQFVADLVAARHST